MDDFEENVMIFLGNMDTIKKEQHEKQLQYNWICDPVHKVSLSLDNEGASYLLNKNIKSWKQPVPDALIM